MFYKPHSKNTVLSVRFYVTTYRAELKSDKWFVVTSMLH